jgi:hypothetical protein
VTGTDALAGPFLDLWPAGHPWPALLLNGTSSGSGGRLITSNLDLRGEIGADQGADPEAGTDLLGGIDAEIAASTAVDNSARFPYLSPLGVLHGAHAGEAARDLVGDGGYFEDYGATTLLELLDRLRNVARGDATPVRFVVLQIVGVPADAATPAHHFVVPRGLLGPLATLLNTRSARGTAATQALARRVAALGGTYDMIRLGVSPTGGTAPLSWSLSAVARHVIAVQWTADWRARIARELRVDW